VSEEIVAAPAVAKTDFDHYSLKFRDHPREVAAELNAAKVSYTDAHGGFYVFGGYETVRRAVMDPTVFASGRPPESPELQGVVIPPSEGLPSLPVEADGEYHRGLRLAMAPHFQKRTAIEWRPRFEHWAQVSIDTVIESGSVNFVRDIAKPVALMFALEILGLPVEDWRKWQEPAQTATIVEAGSPLQEENSPRRAANIEELREMIVERRQNPGDDLISSLATTEVNGALLAVDDILRLSENAMFAVEPSASVVTNGLIWLNDRRDLRASLANDERRLETAVEEWLRYFPPNHGLARTVAVDTEVNGCPMQRGDRVLLSWLAANHDPQQFENPDVVDVDRNPNPHLAFGAGIHECLGLHYARVEALVTIEQVLRRLPDYHIDMGAVVPFPNNSGASGHLDVPATFTPGQPLGSERLAQCSS
jgi:cytochrome P450